MSLQSSKTLRQIKNPHDARNPNNNHFIYILSMDGGPTKIGKSWDAGRRQAQLEQQYGQRLYMLGSYPVGQNIAYQVERYAQWLLRDKHLRNEWFDASKAEAINAVEQALAGDYHPNYLIPSPYPAGKKPLYADRVESRFARGTIDVIQQHLREGEMMADFIRDAVAREIERRGGIAPCATPSPAAKRPACQLRDA